MTEVRPSVYFVGLRATGKTSIGRELAALLSVPFWDSDRAIEEATGRSAGAWLREDGVAAFRRIEAATIIERLDERLLPQSMVMALGGGSLENRTVRERLATLRTSSGWLGVWLRAPCDVLVRRMATAGEAARPRLTGLDPEGECRRLERTRGPILARFADVVVDVATTETRARSPLELARWLEVACGAASVRR
ncbi:MAG: shikimate kinase [Planctomycetes bacterium]|nr:shikimate kinase [Planctomycetota bacterium]MCB9918471.1 shikimate kinase [Planctomycetota bacterium]